MRSGEIFGVKVEREYRVAKTSVMEYIEDARVAYPKRRKKWFVFKKLFNATLTFTANCSIIYPNMFLITFSKEK